MAESGQGGDRDLFARFLAGDREAFTLIYSLHSPAVFRFALHMSGDRMKAAEITQDVFLWLMGHARHFDPSRGEPGAFLIGVTRKFLAQQRRSERRWAPLDESTAGQGRKTLVQWPLPEPVESSAARLRQAIALLPARYREVVVLCDLEGSSYEAAAAALECAVGTVRSRLHRARGLLARKLGARKESPRKESQRCTV
jgi:RNA polymerase sigma-70 factor (ECF subfamily)